MIKQFIGAMALTATATFANAAAIHNANDFTNVLARNDDGSTGSVAIGFNLNFYGQNFSNLFVNNNGNVTFNNSLGTYTPTGLTTSSLRIIAPFWADVDTRNSASNVVTYGQSVINGRNVFGVNWINVGYYASQADKLNSFQLILTERNDTGAGNFDIEFNYDKIQWETGSASGGVNGFGGTSAAAGYTDGGANDYEFAGSRVHSAFLDSNPNGLIYGSLNSTVAGQYVFTVRNGAVVPEPETYAMMLLGLAAVVAARKKKSA
jgi:hypothetical protein